VTEEAGAFDVKAARDKLGMTQSELAEALGLRGPNAKDTVRSWESGKRNVTGPVVLALRYLLKYGPLED
jgi:DNA-binding transcriptional regulator YiaG